jgi:1,4-dihydroxy-2-naphthoate octaprenyltransferase
MPASSVQHAVLLTRPYSWIDAGLTVVLGFACATGGFELRSHGLVVLVGMCVWVSLNWISERVQRDPGRTPVSWPLALAPLLLGMGIAFSMGGRAVLSSAVALVFLLFLYPNKARSPFVGPFGPVIRGLEAGLMVTLGFCMAGRTDIPFALVLGLGLAQIARSLIGDIRDHASDKYELPQGIGVKRAKIIAAALLVGSGLAMALADAHLPILLVCVVQTIVAFRADTKYSYLVHMFMILASVLVKGGLDWHFAGLPYSGFALLLVLQFLLFMSYGMVPRPANRAWSEWLDMLMQRVKS